MSNEAEDEPSAKDIQKVVNSQVVPLIESGRAKWIYLNEGNNNIAVALKLTEFVPKKYEQAHKLVDNTVLRVKKKIKTKYIGKVIPDEVAYSKYFYDYIAKNDEAFSKVVADHHDIKLSLEVVESIENGIQEDRAVMIAGAKIIAPMKTFQEVDKDLRYATIMPNISSEYCSSHEGVVRHAELKLGLIIPKPMQTSFLQHLKDTYTQEQCESVDWFKNKSRFTAKQASLLLKSGCGTLCKFNPYDLLSPDKKAFCESLKELFVNGPEYAKVFKEGVQHPVTDSDLDTLHSFLSQGILKEVERYQKVDESDLDEITTLYKEVSEEDPNPPESIRHYFETFFEREEMKVEEGSREYKWRRVLDWIVAESVKDSSIMVKWLDRYDGTTELIDMKLIDIDTKLCTKLPDYKKEQFGFFCDYAEYLLNPEKRLNKSP